MSVQDLCSTDQSVPDWLARIAAAKAEHALGVTFEPLKHALP
jgi:hypothetical protein